MDCPSFSDLFRVGRDEMLAAEGRLTRAIIERDGSDTNLFLRAVTAQAEEGVNLVTRAAASNFYDSSKGIDLDALVFDRTGLRRKDASAAIGAVRFSSVAGVSSAFQIPAGTVLSTSSGTVYLTTAAAIFPVGAGAFVDVPVRSQLAGANQQAGAGTITSLVSPLTGQPTDLKVTNTLATAGADDEETDQALRDRARGANVEVGTVGAVEQAALKIGGIRRARAFEVLDASGRPARYVVLVCSDAFTDNLVNAGTVVSYQAQSQQLAATIFAALSSVRPIGIYVQPIIAQSVLQNVQLSLSFQGNVDQASVAMTARAAIVNAINDLLPGQNLQVGYLRRRLALVQGLQITGAEIVFPSADIIAKPLQIIRASLSTVSVVSATSPSPTTTTSPSANSGGLVVQIVGTF